MAAGAGALAALRTATVSFGQGAYKAATDLGPMVSGLAKFASMANGAGAAIGGTSVLMRGLAISLGEAADAAKVSAETAALIRSTGDAANVSSGHIERLADRVSRYAAVDATAVQAAENMLLTLGGVRNEVGEGNRVFDRATMAAADLAARWGTDVRTAAMDLGQALKHPVQGYEDLERRGVRFTDSQKRQIRQLAESGKTFKAQKVVMDAVGRSVSGAARGQAQPLDRMRVALRSVAQTLGSTLLPYLNRAATAVTRFIRRLQDSGQITRWMRTLRTILDGVSKVLNVLGKTVVPFFAKEFEHRFGGLVRMVRGLIGVFRGLGDFLNAFIHKDFRGMWEAAKRIIRGAADFFLGVFENVTAPVRAAIEMIWTGLGGAAAGVFQKITDGIETGLNTVIDMVNKAIRVYQGLPGIAKVFGDIDEIGYLGDRGGQQHRDEMVAGGSKLTGPTNAALTDRRSRSLKETLTGPLSSGSVSGGEAAPGGPVPRPKAKGSSVGGGGRVARPAVTRPLRNTDALTTVVDSVSGMRRRGVAAVASRITNVEVDVNLNGREIAKAFARAMEEGDGFA